MLSCESLVSVKGNLDSKNLEKLDFAENGYLISGSKEASFRGCPIVLKYVNAGI